MTPKEPVLRFCSGHISASVFEVERGKEIVPVVRLAKRGVVNGTIKETQDFEVTDLPVVAILARKAFEALALDQKVRHT